MKGTRQGESRAKESNPREPGKRRCAKCGRLHFLLMKKMGIKSGFTFWNLVFLLTVSCVKGRSAFFLGGGEGGWGGMGWGSRLLLDGGELTRHQRETGRVTL